MTRGKLFIALGSVVLVAGLATFFLLRHSGHNYVNVLPENSRAVAEVDLTTLSEPGLAGLIKTSLHWDSGDLERLGLSTDRPAYLFATAEGQIGLVAAIQDMSQLSEGFQAQRHAVETQRGLKWCSFGSWLAAFDRHRLLVMEADGGVNEALLRKQMVEMMKSSEPATLLSSLGNQPGCIRMAADLDVSMLNVPNELLHKLLSLLMKDVPTLQASLDLGEQSYSLSANLLQSSPDDIRTHIQLGDVLHPMRGGLTEVGPERPLLWACMNISGEQLLPLLRKVPAMRTMLIAANLFFDADVVIRSIEGDVSLAVSEADSVQRQWLLTAQLADTGFLRKAQSWEFHLGLSSAFRLTRLHDYDYLLVTPTASFYFGVRGDMLYVTPSATLAAEACLPTPTADGFDRSRAEGQQLFVMLDASRALPMLSSILKSFASR